MTLILLPLLFAAQSTATPAPAAAPERQALICRPSHEETGSRIRKGKQCKTAEEWAREDEERTRMSPSARMTEGQGDSLTRSPPH
jgi:hypothetical protein